MGCSNDTELSTQRPIDYRPAVHELAARPYGQAKTAGKENGTIPSCPPKGLSITDQLCTHCQRGLPANSKNRRLPPAVHARRKEERKNEKLNLSTYIINRRF